MTRDDRPERGTGQPAPVPHDAAPARPPLGRPDRRAPPSHYPPDIAGWVLVLAVAAAVGLLVASFVP